MTLSSLAWIIVLAIAAQSGVWVAAALHRRWHEHASPRPHAARFSEAMPTAHQRESTANWEGFRPFRVESKLFENEEQSICSFHLLPVDGAPLPPFKPGQYLTLQLDVPGPANAAPRQMTRCYSLSDRPRPDYYRITVKRVAAPPERDDLPPGVVSNHLHDAVQEGDLLMARAPSGPFHLDGRASSPIALVGGGIGITPMLSMVEMLLHEGSEREIWLFYGVRNGGEQAMAHRLKQLDEQHPNLHLQVCYSRPGKHDIAGVDYQHHGRVDIDRLRLTLPRRVETFYVCGPPTMMESLVPALEAWGVPPEQIHYEAFGPASVKRRQPPPVAAVSEAATVTFARSGRRLDWDPNAGSLLEFAEANGVAVESGCRAGACGGCQTAVANGEVAYLQPPEAEPEAGTCLLCISTPKGDVTLSA